MNDPLSAPMNQFRAMGTIICVALLACFMVSAPAAVAQTDTQFEPGCKLPFADIAEEHHGVDDFCGIGGVAAANDIGNQQQNRIKNNFCSTGAAVLIQPKDLITLQKKVDALQDFKYGSGRSVPKDRSPLDNIGTVAGNPVGEGTKVVVIGYMVDAHYSDTKKGEGVNCKKSGNVPNDIHFSISNHPVKLDKATKQASLCKLVTGEITPHYRPASWEVAYLTQLEGIPLRLTGQLFFDASHVPCRPGKPVNPARAAVWEIHPIYDIDVCKSKKQCRASVDADWQPLNEWAEALDQENASEKDEEQ